MAKVSVMERNKKRRRTVVKWRERRTALKRAARDPSLSREERMEALKALQKLPRNASPCRLRNRCMLTGRANGYYRKFGLGRNKLREFAMSGDIPGLLKSSW